MRRTAALRGVFALVLGVTAAVHALHAVRGDSGSQARHALFVALNLLGAVLLVTRPRAAFVFLAVLAVQQFQSHGSALLESLRAHAAGTGPFDWTSLLVLCFFPAVLLTLWPEWRNRRGPS